jgi:iron complex outermembrane receptor protein
VPVEEIVVRGSRPEEKAAPLTITEREAEAARPVDLGGLLDRFTDLALSTNSRGERLLSVRGRSEREASLVLAGVPLRDPWDQRFDLNLLPAAAFGGARLEAYGSPAYGSGSVTHLAFADGIGAQALAEGGSGGLARIEARAGRRAGALAVSALTRDGQTVSGDADLPFEEGDGLRLNTDREQWSALAHTAAQRGDLSVEAFALHARGAYGVAPEGQLDPAAEDPRAWRVPKDERSIFAVRMGRQTEHGGLRLSAWHHRTHKVITSYTDLNYTEQEEREVGRDRESGALGIGQFGAGPASLSVGGSLVFAARNEDGEGFADRFTRVTGAGFAAVKIEQGSRSLEAGIRREGFATGETGGRPEGPDLSLTTGHLTASLAAPGPWEAEFTAARIGRLPTQRELYGEALGRFLVNPDLEPETGFAFSARLAAQQGPFAFTAEPFYENSDGTIAQERVATETGIKRRRVNLDGTRTFGLSLAATYDGRSHLIGTGRVTFLDLETDNGEPVPERPEALALFELAYAPPAGIGGLLQFEHRGEAFSLAETSGFARLDPANLFSGELSYRWDHGGVRPQFYVRVDNMFDKAVLPQLGLPGPGRTLRAGLTITSVRS